MKFLGLEKVRDGKYLKTYDLTYLNKADKEKHYEIVSHNEITDPSELGKKVSGLSIVAIHNGKLLLLKEFRMGVNREIINLCAGMKEKDETIEECLKRELYEETGLSLKRIITILPPSFAAVALSDIKNQIAIIEAEGEIEEHTSVNEQIKAAFYTPEECKELLKTREFTSRCQVVTYFFSEHLLDGLIENN